jgi:hypothetical protein
MGEETEWKKGDVHAQSGHIFQGYRRYRRPDGTYRIAERWASPACQVKNNKEAIRAANAAYYQANKERILHNTAQWKKKNPQISPQQSQGAHCKQRPRPHPTHDWQPRQGPRPVK